MLKLNTIDYIFIIFLLIFVYKGYTVNFINQVFPIIAILLGIYIAYFFSPIMKKYFVDSVFQKEVSFFEKTFSVGYIVSFMSLFILVNFGINQLSKYLNMFLSILYLNWVNVLLGIIFSLLKALIILTLIISVLDFINLPILKNDFFNSQITFYILLFKHHFFKWMEGYLSPYENLVDLVQ